MLLRPLEISDADGAGECPSGGPRRSQVVVTVGGAQFTSCFSVPPADSILRLQPPVGTEEVAAGLDGRHVELRWRNGAGVACARGTLVVEPSAPWAVHPDRPIEVREERLFRRVPVKVPVSIMVVRDGRPVVVATRTVNVSVGGAAVEFCAELEPRPGEFVSVGVDPADGRVLTGATIIDPGSADVPMRLRFDQISVSQQDRLVGLINREELRCSLR